MSLREYERKRKLGETPEPVADSSPHSAGGRRFCLQRHQARHLHYDLRLELGPTLRSWALPKGPTLGPLEKRLAVPTEDHPLSYLDWEGVIPPGHYGAGVMMVFDIGDWDPVEEGDPAAMLEAGELKLRLWGQKVQGEWTLVRSKADSWLMIKKADGWADPQWDPEQHLWSAVSGRTPEEIEAGEPAPRPRSRQWPAGAVEAALPLEVEPMLAQPAKPFDDPDWLFELKWDGIRALAFGEQQSQRLVGRRGRSLSGNFPELRYLRANLAARSYLLDGELVVLDSEGRPDFSRILSRLKAPSSRALARSARSDRAVYYIFDLLYLDGYDLRAVSFEQRRELLAEVLRTDSWIRLSETVEGVGRALFALALERGLEGLMAKRRSSPYEAGRSPCWRKLKARHTADVVVVGFTPSNASAPFGALHIARFVEHTLVSVGKVGTGFTASEQTEILTQLTPLPPGPSPVKGLESLREAVTWVEPSLVIEIEYAELTRDGVFSHSSYLRRRDDLRPEDCSDQPLPRGEAFLEADGRTLTISNPQKLLFPRGGQRKIDMIEYYDRMAPFMLPHLADRPLSMRRYPDGVEGPDFFQKHPGPGTPEGITVDHPERGKLVVVRDRASLLQLANLACLEFHVTLSHLPTLETPDGFVLDFDPQGAPFSVVKSLALAAGEVLEELGWQGFVKTSGGRGIHLFVPLAPEYSFEHSRMAAGVFAEILRTRHPDQVTLERAPGRRPAGTVYIDTPQNRSASTMACAYSLRATPLASWSAPLRWDELRGDVEPEDFLLAGGPARVAEVGELWSMRPEPRHRLEEALPRLEEMLTS
jgi:bifunctional non-homologous end joining protein LigD